MKNKKKKAERVGGSRLAQLFFTFLKIGAFTFGGGYAMIPIVQRETVENHRWITDDELLDIIAIAESTPGPIAVNSATFVGYRVGGTAGALLASLGVILPSFTVILLISLLLRRFGELRPVRYAFFGIRAGVLALILHSLFKIARSGRHDIFSIVIAVLSFAAVAIFDVNALFVVPVAAAVGLIYARLIRGRLGK